VNFINNKLPKFNVAKLITNFRSVVSPSSLRNTSTLPTEEVDGVQWNLTKFGPREQLLSQESGAPQINLEKAAALLDEAFEVEQAGYGLAKVGKGEQRMKVPTALSKKAFSNTGVLASTNSKETENKRSDAVPPDQEMELVSDSSQTSLALSRNTSRTQHVEQTAPLPFFLFSINAEPPDKQMELVSDSSQTSLTLPRNTSGTQHVEQTAPLSLFSFSVSLGDADVQETGSNTVAMDGDLPCGEAGQIPCGWFSQLYTLNYSYSLGESFVGWASLVVIWICFCCTCSRIYYRGLV